MSQERQCLRCGQRLTPGAADGLCPACLLRKGLETNTAGFTADAPATAWSPPPPKELAPLFPELEILGLIGRGGMGAVYKARQKNLDRLVALKILPPEIGRDPAFAERFAREAQAMARLSHPHIVPIYDFGQRGTGTQPARVPAVEEAEEATEEEAHGQDARGTHGQDAHATNGLFFFLMEYIDGLSLRQLLDRGGVSPKEALAIVPQICEALQFAHDQGIVHRDIKPENILLDRRGQVKIADFGLAKLVARGAGVSPVCPTAVPAVGETEDETAHGQDARDTHGQDAHATTAGHPARQVMGTPQYMAPEQIDRPAEVDHRADIYSLGVVFYQMLTGELPKGKPGDAFDPPSRKVLIDVRLDEVVLRALEREPQRRYQQASEVKTQVETIVQTSADPGAQKGAVLPAKGPHASAAFGFEYRSKRALFGLPLLHVAMGYDPATGRKREARGIIAIGDKATGVAAMGGTARGFFAFGGLAIGVVAFGGFAIGLLSFGGMALALGLAYGGFAVGPLAFGGVAVGYYCLGGLALGVHAAGGNAYDEAARDLFGGQTPYALSAVFWAVFILTMGTYLPLLVWARRKALAAARPLHPIPVVPFSRPSDTATRTTDDIQSARQQVRTPAIGLIAAAAISLSVIISMLAYILIWIGTGPGAPFPSSGLSSSVIVAILLAAIALNAFVLFAAMGMMHLKGYRTARAASMLAIFLSPGDLIGLPMGLWSLIVLHRPAVRAGFGLPPGRRHWLARLLVTVGVAVAVALLLWTFVIQEFRVETDALAPELTKGSRVFVYKLANEWTAGDILLYREGDHNMLGRFLEGGPGGTALVGRNGQPPQAVAWKDVTGKVVFLTRGAGRGSSRPADAVRAPEAASSPAARIALLEEVVRAREKEAAAAEAKFKSGIVNRVDVDEAAANLLLAKAELAAAQGPKAAEQIPGMLQSVVALRERQLEMVGQLYQGGQIGHEAVLNAEAKLAKAKAAVAEIAAPGGAASQPASAPSTRPRGR